MTLVSEGLRNQEHSGAKLQTSCLQGEHSEKPTLSCDKKRSQFQSAVQCSVWCEKLTAEGTPGEGVMGMLSLQSFCQTTLL